MQVTRAILWGVLSVAVVAVTSLGSFAADEPGNEAIEMIANLLSDKDRDMRTVGLQQVREEVKGEAATKQFAALLPKLAPEVQAELIDALGDRGDKAARGALLEMLKTQEPKVRVAAVRALGALGEVADVPMLATSLAASSAAERTAARTSLARLRGAEVDAAIVAQLKEAKPQARAGLLAVLAGRGAKTALPSVLEATGDTDATVRVAAVAALRVLADPNQTAAVVRLVKAAANDDERWNAEQTLLAVCSRGHEECVPAIVSGLSEASPAASVVLLGALARAGGNKALERIVIATKDPQPDVVAAALRLLANWPDVAAIPHLRAIAEGDVSLKQNVVAIQGLVKLASPLRDRAANVAGLSAALKLAKRPDEKRLALGVLRGVATAESLEALSLVIDDPAVTEDACQAAIAVAEKITGPDIAKRKAVLEKVRTKSKTSQTRDKAQKVLESLGPG